MKHVNIFCALAALLIISAMGCTLEPQRKCSESSLFEKEKGLSQHIDKVIHDLPPPTEVPFILRSMGADFMDGIVNGLEHVEEYKKSNSKLAMNLGIYSTDIGYLACYNHTEKALTYIEVCQKIAEYIGISTAYGEDLGERFKKNMGNIDSLAVIINQGMGRIEERLEKLNELSMASLSLTGSFIEGLYIITKIIESHENNDQFNRKENKPLSHRSLISLSRKKCPYSTIFLCLNPSKEMPMSFSFSITLIFCVFAMMTLNCISRKEVAII